MIFLLAFIGNVCSFAVMYKKIFAILAIVATVFTTSAQNLGTSQTLSTRIAALETNLSTYGGIFENSANGNAIVMTTLGVFYPWVGSTVAYTNRINSNGTNLVTTAAGYYDISGGLRGLVPILAGSTNHTILGAIFTNDVRCVLFSGLGVTPPTNSATAGSLPLSITISGPPVYLPSSCRVDIRIANTNSTLAADSFTNQQSFLAVRRIY